MAKNQESTNKQKDAISHFKGPALVIAGPGAGKTFVMTERVKKLISDKEIDPKKILVTTFTEKAANELKVKLARTIGKKAELIHISTIHSFCKSMLEKYFLHHEYGTEIDILDSDSQKLFIELNRVNLGISTWDDGKLENVKSRFNFIKDIQAFYDTLTQNEIVPEELIIFLEKKGNLSEADKKLAESYRIYRDLLQKERKIDFASLQTFFYNIIKENEEALKDIQKNFEYILVDEYQDTSPIQDKIFRLISGKNQNLFVVGDENQSIYGFRGASIKNFKNFLERFPKSKHYFLNTNFRSTKNIIEFSNKVFDEEVRKVLESKRRDGEKIKLILEKDSDTTAKKTVELIKEMKTKGIIRNYGDVSLLFRSLKNHSPEYIKYLSGEKIPFVTFGDGKFLEREEIKTIIYLISYVTQQLYLDNKFKKWKNWWKKDIFLTDFFNFSDNTKQIIKKGEFNLYDLRHEEDFKKKGFVNKKDILKLKKINKLKYKIEGEKETLDEESNGNNSILKIFYHLLEFSGYFKRLMSNLDSKNKEIMNNLGRLSEIINRYMAITKKEDIKGFLWHIYNSEGEIDQSKIEDENAIKLMTVHKAKGLEFPVVFLCCLNEGRFPLTYKDNALFEIPSKFLEKGELEDEKEEHYHEERRLFYVGLTRAQDNLIFTSSEKHRVQRQKMSRFISKIPKELISDSEFKLPTEKQYKLDKQIPNLNYSAINTFIDCPLRYTLVYDYNFVTPPSFMQALGTFIHNTLQKIHEAMKKQKDISPAEMKEIVNTYWIDLPISKFKNNSIREKKVKDFVRYYLSVKEDYKQILGIEESFSHIDDNMIVKGNVDLIVENKEGKTCLIDFKARKSEGIKETNVDKQLQIYDYCLENKYSVDKIIAHTFEDNKKTEFPLDKGKTKEFLSTISKKMEKEDFHKKKNEFCRQCPFSFYCWGEKK